MIPGLDVSKYQGKIPWKAVYEHGERFVFIRSADGVKHVDPMFIENVNGAREAGLLTGTYFFFRPSQSVDEQATLLFDMAHGLVEMPPMVDFETLDGCPPEETAKAVMEFIRLTEKLWSTVSLFYTYPSFLHESLKGIPESYFAAFSSRPLAIAHYGVAKPFLPRWWTNWTFWQWDGDKGQRLPNERDSDFMYYAGTLEQLANLSNTRPWFEKDGHLPLDNMPPKPAVRFNDWVQSLDLSGLTREVLDEEKAAREKRRSDEEMPG